MSPAKVSGLLLAAGAGTRFGMPKILVPGWLQRSVDALWSGGCSHVYVVTGAARPPMPESVTEIHCPDWSAGIGASLRCGIQALGSDTELAVIHLIDYPDIGPAVIHDVLEVARSGPMDGLHRAVFQGRPGHPVAISRTHFLPLVASLTEGEGAATYLASHSCIPVDCSHLATGRDADTPVEAREIHDASKRTPWQ